MDQQNLQATGGCPKQGAVCSVFGDEITIIDCQGTIHILREHLYSTKLNLTSKFFTNKNLQGRIEERAIILLM